MAVGRWCAVYSARRSQREQGLCNRPHHSDADLRKRKSDRTDLTNQRGPVHDHRCSDAQGIEHTGRSEEHTSELQSRFDLVCRLLLEKKKKIHLYMSSTNDTLDYMSIT